MQVSSRGRLDNPLALARRAAPAAIVAAVLAGAIFAPSASAGPADDLTAVIKDYAPDGHITPCAFSKAQLQSAGSQITPDFDAYAPDFRSAVNAEIARWSNGGCSKAGGQQSSYRATITSLKVAKTRRSVKVKLSCPASAAASCHVKLTGKLAGKGAAKKKSATVGAGKTKTVKVKLKSAARHRLSTQGGKLKISAKTVGSTLAASSRSATIAASS